MDSYLPFLFPTPSSVSDTWRSLKAEFNTYLGAPAARPTKASGSHSFKLAEPGFVLKLPNQNNKSFPSYYAVEQLESKRQMVQILWVVYNLQWQGKNSFRLIRNILVCYSYHVNFFSLRKSFHMVCASYESQPDHPSPYLGKKWGTLKKNHSVSHHCCTSFSFWPLPHGMGLHRLPWWLRQ